MPQTNDPPRTEQSRAPASDIAEVALPSYVDPHERLIDAQVRVGVSLRRMFWWGFDPWRDCGRQEPH